MNYNYMYCNTLEAVKQRQPQRSTTRASAHPRQPSELALISQVHHLVARKRQTHIPMHLVAATGCAVHQTQSLGSERIILCRCTPALPIHTYTHHFYLWLFKYINIPSVVRLCAPPLRLGYTELFHRFNSFSLHTKKARLEAMKVLSIDLISSLNVFYIPQIYNSFYLDRSAR